MSFQKGEPEELKIEDGKIVDRSRNVSMDYSRSK